MEWEQCKENVKPKREGRTVSNIATPKKDNAAIAEIQERQAEFEKEIEGYEGEDELEVWDRYVRFMDNAYPEGDAQSQVSAIQFRLARKFMKEEKLNQYRNDPRLLNTFIDFANHAPDATQVYGFCYSKRIALKLPRFWDNYAHAFIYKGMYHKALKTVEKACKIFPDYRPFKGLNLEIIKLINQAEIAPPAAPIVRSVGSTLGGDVRQDPRQKPARPALGNQNEGLKFSVMSDRDVFSTPVPSNSCNPLDRKRTDKENASRKPQRWKDCAVYTDAVPTEQAGTKFSVFEEGAHAPTKDIMTPRHNTTALTAKKVPTQGKSAGSFEQQVNSNTQRNECVAYSKSKVYPRGGAEWSFEELWAKHRFLKNQQDSITDLSTVDESLETDSRIEHEGSRKRSSSAEGDCTEDKKRCTENLVESSVSIKLPLKSCITPRASTLSSTNFYADFAPENTISSSTRKVQEEDRFSEDDDNFDVFTDEPELSVMRPDKSLLTDNRPKLKLAESFQSNKVTVLPDAPQTAPQTAMSQTSVNAIDNEDFFDVLSDDEGPQQKGQFTLDNLESSMNARNFSIFEDPTQMRHAVAAKLGLSSKKQLLVDSLEESHEQFDEGKDYKPRGLSASIASSTKLPEPEFEIFENIESPAEKTQTGFSMYSNIRKADKRRESLAFDIFSDEPEPVNESNEYHLKTIMKTPYSDKPAVGDVPWTWGKVDAKNSNKDDTAGIREYTKSNTMKINEQVHDGLFGDAESDSSASESNAPSNPKPSILKRDNSERQSKGRVCFGEISSPANDIEKDQNISRVSTGSETAMVPAIASIANALDGKFEGYGYQDNYYDSNEQSPLRLDTSQEDLEHKSIDLQYRTLPSELIESECRKQLTPILEGSMDSHMSSNVSSKASLIEFCTGQTIVEEDSVTLPVLQSITVPIKDVSTIDSTGLSYQSEEHTATIANPSSGPRRSEEKTTNIFIKPKASMNQTMPLLPDKTQRDVSCDPSFLKKAPRHSVAPKAAISNPYEQGFINDLIQSLDPPLFYRSGFHTYEEHLKWKTPLQLGKMAVKKVSCIGEGAFAKVYKGECYVDNNKSEAERAFKVQSPSAPWEFYILSEVSERLTKSKTSAEVIDMILSGLSMHIYSNVSVLVTPCFMEGNLLDLTNIYRKASPAQVPEVVILTYALDMLRCVQALHNIGIIHGDIKPDNWLLRDKENTINSMSMLYTKSVVLIDFGRSIDMELMPPGSFFTTSCNTDLFECVEMQTNRPWTYQVDYYGVLACIYLLFHNEYMKVCYDKRVKKWMPVSKPPRRVNRELFEELFSDLLNIKDCTSIPPLDSHIAKLQDYLHSISASERRKQLKSHYSFVSSMSL